MVLLKTHCFYLVRLEDYNRLCAKLQHWGVPPRTFPWKKYVLTIYGTTSAGKSSLVNHLFTLTVARSGGWIETIKMRSGYLVLIELQELKLILAIQYLRHCQALSLLK